MQGKAKEGSRGQGIGTLTLWRFLFLWHGLLT
jgi:hypothetical protein